MQCQQTTTQFSPFLHPILVCDNYKRHRRDNNRDMSRQICVPSHLLHVTRNNSLRWCWWTLDHCLMFVIFAKVNRMLFIVYKSNLILWRLNSWCGGGNDLAFIGIVYQELDIRKWINWRNSRQSQKNPEFSLFINYEFPVKNLKLFCFHMTLLTFLWLEKYLYMEIIQTNKI